MVYKATYNNVKIASKFILNGDIIIYPTDTIYGFGVDATNSLAINNLNILKKRIQPYSIIVDSFSMLNKYSEIDKTIEDKLRNFFPGAFTAILRKKDSNLSKLVNCGLTTIGIRIPSYKFVQNIVKNINKPIITTSVNIHGENPLNNIDDIIEKYSNLNIFIDGINKASKGSTIIDFSGNTNKLLRQGDGIYKK